MENNWRTHSSEILWWELRVPGGVTDPSFRRWQRAVLDAGEEHAVYRILRASGPAPVDYQRARDGYLGDYLDAHPALLAPGRSHPGDPGMVFSLDYWPSARLAYVDADDEIREFETDSTADFPNLKRAEWHTEAKPPLQIYAGVDDGGIGIAVTSFTTIWLPWQPNEGYVDPDLEADELADNRHLAARHTPRLNAFLTDIGDAARAEGGWMRLDRRETPSTYVPFVTDNGVILDLSDRSPEWPARN